MLTDIKKILCIAIYVSITDNVEVYFSFVLMSVFQFFIFWNLA